MECGHNYIGVLTHEDWAKNDRLFENDIFVKFPLREMYFIP